MRISDHPLYVTWMTIKTRCYNASHPTYAGYGSRGIVMCDEWRNDFLAFLRDVGERQDGLTLDRIDNNGNYEPGNVRWAARVEQVGNRRSTFRVEWKGEEKTLMEVCDENRLNYVAIYSAMSAGLTFEEAMKWVSDGCPKGIGHILGERIVSYRATSFVDLTGKQFGRWTVLHHEPTAKRGSSQWWCKCECGAEKSVQYSALTGGRTKSCGCLRRELARSRNRALVHP
jgi:hypothetical protein